MPKDEIDKTNISYPSRSGKIAKGVFQTVGGAIPLVGGLVSAAASAWSENEQDHINRIFEHWIQMLKDELREKEITIIEVMARIDLLNEKVSKRVESKEYQSLIRKTFREWSGIEDEEKRVYVRNILANAASADISSDDVVRLFIDWISQYSVLHFQVIRAIYNNDGITRGEIWEKIGKGQVREDSADADLYKLLFRDLSTGGIVRQHREKDYYGNFVAKKTVRSRGSGAKQMKSAFDSIEKYELTELGTQFIHYAMTDLPLKIEYSEHIKDDLSAD